MLNFNDATLSALLSQYLLPFFRVTALFMVMPIFGAKVIGPKVRVVLGICLTLLVAPLIPPVPPLPLLSLQMVAAIIYEIAIGVACGFAFLVVFQVFVLAGQFIALKLGMGFASMNDPASGVSVTSLSQFYLTMVTLMFVSANGPLMVIEMLVNSFHTLPIANQSFTSIPFQQVAHLGTWLFAAALVMSMPVFASSMLVNIAFGIMSRSAPQLNIFAIGFPFTILCGLLIIAFGLNTLIADFISINSAGFEWLGNFLEVSK